ncbi:SDR family NAD(P)-dependent oxidoreductase [Shimazuella alba]|jgi:NAD(P)-dependent dehydrogenase (short-subunit alcohol dehydrogenase family)|uniref:SDR family NAD(P)-dependent oxidoreductase n=1 Tax=Shimazuella alba TaxID=2690964 RepID=A0A6I4VV39_9BACL|nr:SDR family NAD(P)-dependent oxidoreductase [Shimazuella alba]MXQ55729.1 SDR family NAD(P)-dependent oxidoreductase [Shimazuella alba]
MRWLKEKTVLITGGGAGIGKAIVDRFVAEGANLLVFDISKERLVEIDHEFEGKVATYQGDVRSYSDNEQAVACTIERFGKLDCLVANAGLFDGFVKLLDYQPEVLEQTYQQLFDINVKGAFHAARAALPELMKTKGNMIFSVSGSSFYPDGGGTIYTATKHAVLGLIRQLAFEAAPTVRVNGVAPGGTITDLKVVPSLEGLAKQVSKEEKKASIQSRNPLRMYMVPEDHVASYVLLASDQARAITGEVINSNGGLTVRGLS